MTVTMVIEIMSDLNGLRHTLRVLAGLRGRHRTHHGLAAIKNNATGKTHLNTEHEDDSKDTQKIQDFIHNTRIGRGRNNL
jgi:hypothetical protein